MLRSLISRLALAAGLLAAPVAIAADDHDHDKGPHGGEVKGFGKFHLEGVRQGDKATFYVLGDDGKTSASVVKHDGGTVTVIAPGAAQDKEKIPSAGSFSETSVKVPAKGKVTVLVSLKEAGKAFTAKFNFSK